MDRETISVDVGARPPSGGGIGFGLPAVLTILFLLSAAILPLTSRWRGDEAFYTDGAVRMFETGDFLAPRAANGLPRYQKPPLTYWAVAASHRLFDGGYFGARLPSLLAAVATLAIAWSIALRLFGSREIAWAAVGLLLGSGHLIKLSARATPDMLQCAFASLSLLGLASMLFARRFTWPNRLMFWLGAGLVVATKGGLGVLLIVFGFALAWLRGGRLHIRARQLFHPVPAALAIAIGAAWFIAIVWRDGAAAWSGFWRDQAGSRFDGAKTYLLSNAATYITAWLPDLLPWSVLLVYMAWRDRRTLRAVLREHREAAWFVLGWHGLLTLVFTAGNTARTRYLLPAYILDAPLVAAVLLGWRSRRPAAALRGFAAATALAALAVAVGGLRHLPLALRAVLPDATAPILGWSILAPLLAGTAWAWMRASPPAMHIVLTGSLWMAASRADDLLVRRHVHRPAASAAAESLLRHPDGPPGRLAAVGLRDGNESQLRLLLAGRVQVDRAPSDIAQTGGLAGYDAVVVDERGRDAWPQTTARWELLGEGFLEWSPADFLRLAVGADPDPILSRRRERLFVSWLAPPPTPAPVP